MTTMQKKDLRKVALQKRKAQGGDATKKLNSGLLDQFKKLDFSDVNVLHIFLPILEKNEPDTFPLIFWLKATHPKLKIIIPKTDFLSLEMSNHEFKNKDSLVKSNYNILEPSGDAVYSGPIDLCVLPLLGFDKIGNRVGYGKGFYDRFLSKYPEIFKVGICFDAPIGLIEDAEIHDIRMDACITPVKTYYF